MNVWWMNKSYMNGWINLWTNEWINEWMNEIMKKFTNISVCFDTVFTLCLVVSATQLMMFNKWMNKKWMNECFSLFWHSVHRVWGYQLHNEGIRAR